MLPDTGIKVGLSNHAGLSPLDEPLDITLQRWQEESVQLNRQGIYTWLSSRVVGQRVLEIGCGFGLSTAALAQHGKSPFVLDNRMDCLEATRCLVPDAEYGIADIRHYDDRLVSDLKAFAPEAVVCWLAGAPAESLPRDVPEHYAVMQHRLLFQQAVVRLATALSSVRTIHMADRTAFPWKMKDAGRETWNQMMSIVIADAPFSLNKADIKFRKIENSPNAAAAPGILQQVVPVIGEATLKRIHSL